MTTLLTPSPTNRRTSEAVTDYEQKLLSLLYPVYPHASPLKCPPATLAVEGLVFAITSWRQPSKMVANLLLNDR